MLVPQNVLGEVETLSRLSEVNAISVLSFADLPGDNEGSTKDSRSLIAKSEVSFIK